MADPQAPSAGIKAIRVLIVDDQPTVRQGLEIRFSLEPEVEVIGEAGDGAEAVSLAGSLRPDVVLMDARMPGMEGIEATAALRAVSRALRRTFRVHVEFTEGRQGESRE